MKYFLIFLHNHLQSTFPRNFLNKWNADSDVKSFFADHKSMLWSQFCHCLFNMTPARMKSKHFYIMWKLVSFPGCSSALQSNTATCLGKNVNDGVLRRSNLSCKHMSQFYETRRHMSEAAFMRNGELKWCCSCKPLALCFPRARRDLFLVNNPVQVGHPIATKVWLVWKLRNALRRFRWLPAQTWIPLLRIPSRRC